MNKKLLKDITDKSSKKAVKDILENRQMLPIRYPSYMPLVTPKTPSTAPASPQPSKPNQTPAPSITPPQKSKLNEELLSNLKDKVHESFVNLLDNINLLERFIKGNGENITLSESSENKDQLNLLESIRQNIISYNEKY